MLKERKESPQDLKETILNRYYQGAYIKKSLHKGIIILLFFVTPFTYSQFYHGLEFGANMTNTEFKVGESVEPSSGTGFFIGYLAERELTDHIFVRFAANFNRRNFKAISRRGINVSQEEWGVDAIEIPINLGYYLNWNNRKFQFFIDAGVNLGFNSRAIVKNQTETIRLDIGGESDIKKMALGANAGVGVLIKKRFKLRAHYYHGLTNLINSEGDIWKNKTIGISLSYFVKDKKLVKYIDGKK